MTHDVFAILSQYGVAVVFVNVLLNQSGLLVPVVPTLIIAGGVAAGGQPQLSTLFFSSLAACLMADSGWYFIGQKFGIRVLKTLCKVSLEPDSCVSQTQTRFERWGVNSLVIAKFIPGLSIIAPPMAGALRIGWLRFIVLSICAASLWVGCGLLAGMLFRSQIERLLEHLRAFGHRARARAALDSGRGACSPAGRGAPAPGTAARSGCHFVLHLPERSLGGARRQNPDESRLQAGPPPARRPRCLGGRGLCCHHGGGAGFLAR